VSCNKLLTAFVIINLCRPGLTARPLQRVQDSSRWHPVDRSTDSHHPVLQRQVVRAELGHDGASSQVGHESGGDVGLLQETSHHQLVGVLQVAEGALLCEERGDHGQQAVGEDEDDGRLHRTRHENAPQIKRQDTQVKALFANCSLQ
jgi:hypothetical protein